MDNFFKPMNILEYINYLIEVEGYSEEDAYICADVMFSDRYVITDEDDYYENNYKGVWW